MGSARENFDRIEREAKRGDSEHGKTDRELLAEMAARARRTETRVTMIANHLGVGVEVEKPVYHRITNEVQVPSRKIALDDVLAAIPDDRKGRVDVMCGSDQLVTLFV